MEYKYNGQPVILVPGQQFDSHWNIYVPRSDGGRDIISVDPNSLKQKQPVDSVESENQKAQIVEALNINQASFMDIKKRFPGIGRIAAKAISENKPYESFEDLKRKNSKLNINWDLLKEGIVYE